MVALLSWLSVIIPYPCETLAFLAELGHLARMRSQSGGATWSSHTDSGFSYLWNLKPYCSTLMQADRVLATALVAIALSSRIRELYYSHLFRSWIVPFWNC